MYSPGQPVPSPASAGEAVAMAEAALRYLAGVNAASLPAAGQADTLRGLERLESLRTAARSRVLAAFMAQGGYEDDGHGGPRSWLVWQTRVSRAAAAGAVGWTRRLAAHPVIAEVLAAGEVSCSWARHLCEWSDRLPEDIREDADRILTAAAAAGADLADLARLAEEIYARTASPDADDDGFADRWLRLGVTYRGAGTLGGDLTPGCAAVLSAVLEALGKRAGPEDIRTKGRRDHDALAEACRRLVAAGMLPERAGQPTQVQVHMTLGQLRGEHGAPGAEAAWAAERAGQPGWLTGPEVDAAACDATIIPVVTGQTDPVALSRLTDAFPGRHPAGEALAPATHDRLARALLGLAVDSLSGPDGLAAALRTPGSAARSPGSACHWTWAPPPTPRRRTCGGWSSCATGTAGSRAATSPPAPARSTTSSPGRRVARPG